MLEAPEGPVAILYHRPGGPGAEAWYRRVRPEVTIIPGPCRLTAEWLEAYFDGQPRSAPFPPHAAEWLRPSQTQDMVWRAVSAIPLGQTRTYGDIARRTGIHPRLVGQANGANPLPLWIPCHRVVGAGGALVGYGGGLDRKRWLLAHEERITGLLLGRTPG